MIEITFLELSICDDRKAIEPFLILFDKNKNIIQKLITESNLFYFLFQIGQVQSERSSVRLIVNNLKE